MSKCSGFIDLAVYYESYLAARDGGPGETLIAEQYNTLIQSQNKERAGVVIPVEYKHGQQGNWLNEHIQLCAQAMCLEERQPGKAPIGYGYIYYVGSRRRVQVPFTPQLRARTKAAIAQAFRVAALETPPLPLSGKLAARCPPCSLLTMCMPEEVRMLRAKKE